jgi:hypothetical protein
MVMFLSTQRSGWSVVVVEEEKMKHGLQGREQQLDCV